MGRLIGFAVTPGLLAAPALAQATAPATN